jgi:hypothetical protein
MCLLNGRINTPQGLNLKTLLVGSAAIFAACFMSVSALAGSQTKLSSDWFPFASAILFVFVLFGVNPVLRLINRNLELNRNELLLVFVLLFCAVPMSTSGFATSFTASLATPWFYATDGNQWHEKIIPHLPLWLYPSDYEPIEWFWRGKPPGKPSPYASWLPSIMHWSIMLAAIYGGMVALGSILRKQWVENERLNFPLMEIPCVLTEGFERGLRIPPVLRNRLFWIGFMLPVALYSTHILHGIDPAFPRINFIGKDILRVRPTENWIEYRIHLLPVIVGFGYLVNRDILLSVWLFGILVYFEKNAMKTLGYSPGSAMPNEDYNNPALAFQSTGALAVYVFAGLYMARTHLKEVFKQAVFGRSSLDDAAEVLGYRSSLILLFLCLATAWVFALKMGMTPLVATTLLCALYIVYLAVTRFIIEGGLMLYGTPSAVIGVVVAMYGAAGMKGACFGGLVAFAAINSDTGTGFMPAFVNSLKLGDGRSFKRRAILQAAVIGVVLGAAVSLWATMRYGYENGVVNSSAWGMKDHGVGLITKMLHAQESIPYPDKSVRLAWAGIGGAVMLLITIGRYTFSWWPIHPIGFAICTGIGIQISLFALFVAWASKTVLLKIGGVPLYTKAKPFFYGLLLGHVGIIFAGWAVDVIRDAPGVNLYW